MQNRKRLAEWIEAQWQRVADISPWRLHGALALILIASIVLTNYGIAAVRAQGEESDVTICVNNWNGAMRVLLQGDCDRSEYPMTLNSEGIPGPPGPPGPAGADALAGYTIIVTAHEPTNGESWTMDCPDGHVAIDGGANYRTPGAELYLLATINASPKLTIDGAGSIGALPTGWSFEYSYAGVYVDDGSVVVNDDQQFPVIDSWVSCMNAPAS